MTDYGAGLNEALRGVICVIVSGTQLGQSFAKGIVTGDPSSPAWATAIRRNICNAGPPTDPQVPPPPFTGGQCPVSYRVSGVVNATNLGNGNPATFTYGFTSGGPPTTLTGPISGTAASAGFGCSGANVAARAVGANGSYRLFGCFNPTQFQINSVVITGVQRVDGQPDNCGNPPPVIPDWPPIGSPYNINFDYTDNTNITRNINGTVNVFAPRVGIDGTINVPVKVNLEPNVNLDGTIEIAPNFEVNLLPDTTINYRPKYTVDGPAPSAPNPSEPIPPTTDDPNKDTIIGVIVTANTTASRKATSISKTNQPDIFAPRLGTVTFGISAGGSVYWTPDISVKNSRSYIPCPVNQGAVDVRCEPDPNSGVTLSFTPIRGLPCCEP